MSIKHPLRLVSAVLPLIAIGCVARIEPEPVYAEATYVPADVDVYYHTNYEGRVVYLVDDRWYYRHGPRWVYYRREPPLLYRERVRVQRAPRAHRAPPPRERVYEERRRPAPGVRSAPPATQVR